MKIDAHYYAILGFARACGFNKESAHRVAFASQFVDDAKINLIYLDKDPGVKHDKFNGQHLFIDMATCNSYTRMKTFNYDSMIKNTCAFHFVPGCEGESFSEKLQCNEESDFMKCLLNEAIDQDDLLKLGIVLHAYADTFSHNGFSGILSKANDIEEPILHSKLPNDWREKLYKAFRWFVPKDRRGKLLDKALPAYGHGQAGWYPDLPYLNWGYKYDPSNRFYLTQKDPQKIDNKDRFKRAFMNIKEHLEKYLEKHPQYRGETRKFQEFDDLFNTLIATQHTRKRIREWKKLLVQKQLFEKKELFERKWIFCQKPAIYDYNADKWMQEAFKNFKKKEFDKRTIKKAELAPNFSDSNWYKYYLAVKWYKELFFKQCHQFNLEIPQ